MKIAFIGDSYSAYAQDGQYDNHWSYQLSQQFPQHQYYNYALGGRGADYCQWCLLDAKKRGVDVVFINRTFNHRVAQQYSDNDFEFVVTHQPSTNYFSMSIKHHIWFSLNQIHVMGHTTFHPIAAEIAASLKDKSISEQNQQYNDQWFDNVDQLYNFKHIIKLELLPIIPAGSASHKIDESINLQRRKFLKEGSREEILLNAGLILSLEDDHWSPAANTWVLNNYILTQETIDILSKE